MKRTRYAPEGEHDVSKKTRYTPPKELPHYCINRLMNPFCTSNLKGELTEQELKEAKEFPDFKSCQEQCPLIIPGAVQEYLLNFISPADMKVALSSSNLAKRQAKFPLNVQKMQPALVEQYRLSEELLDFYRNPLNKAKDVIDLLKYNPSKRSVNELFQAIVSNINAYFDVNRGEDEDEPDYNGYSEKIDHEQGNFYRSMEIIKFILGNRKLRELLSDYKTSFWESMWQGWKNLAFLDEAM